MAAKGRFTRLPKIHVLIEAGVPAEAIPTFYALSDHANNRTGECWPSMRRLGEILGKSTRTIQRHLHALKDCGLVEFVERRRYRGRFSSYLYRVIFFASTTGHERRMRKGGPIYKGTKPSKNTPHSPPKEGYEWLFGEPRTSESSEEYDKRCNEERERASKKRQEGYEWLFE